MNFGSDARNVLRHARMRSDIKAELESRTEEIKHLRRCINDLVSILALPAMWSSGEPAQIVHTLFEALLRMLRLDLIYVQAKNPLGEAPIEMLQLAPMSNRMTVTQEICGALNRWLGADPQERSPLIRSPFGDGDISIVSLPLGLQGEIGVIVTGSQRADFPRQTEALLLSVAANQAAIGLQAARLQSEQERFTMELDQRIALRTRELSTINEELRRELAECSRAKDAPSTSERQLHSIVDSIPALIAVMSPTGEVEFLNRQHLEYFGRDIEELRNCRTIDAVHPEDLPHALQLWENSIHSGQPYEAEQRLRRFDGVYLWFQVRGLPCRDTDGRIVHWYVLLTDIDQRKRADEALKRSEAFLAEGQRLARMGNFAWCVENDQITWSEQLYCIFEFEQGSPVTLERIGMRVHPEDIPLLHGMIDQARRGTSDFEGEPRLLMPDGSVKHVHVVGHGTRDQQGRLEYIGAIQEVTQRRLSEEALSQARSELTRVASVTSLGVLTASIAHEINQPLSGIVTNASTCLRMLAADPPNVDGARETARRTIRDGNRASEVVTRLRALFSKKETTIESVDLNEATREVIALLLGELHRDRVVLRPEFGDNLPPVAGDRIQLQQVILNLVRNASDAMSTINNRPRQLLVRTEREKDDRVRLSVQDSGVGIDPQAADRLFEAFYTTKNEGMGIGLSVSRSIIESHHGRIWAAPNDGPGATFSFSLPARSGVIDPGGPIRGQPLRMVREDSII